MQLLLQMVNAVEGIEMKALCLQRAEEAFHRSVV